MTTARDLVWITPEDIRDNTPVGGTDHSVSPSQVDTFLSCERKWAWAKIAKIRAPQHPSAAKGERCHTQLERHLLHGEPPQHFDAFGVLDETGAIVTPSLSTLPEPGTVDVEHTFVFRSKRTGVRYSGRIDWKRLLDPIEEYPEGWCEIGDHKSTSNLRYAKTAAALESDPQGVLYAVAGMAEYEVPTARLHWNYIRTVKPYKVHPVIHTVQLFGVAEEFAKLDTVAKKMTVLIDTVQPGGILDLPANRNTCNAYGGCPYRHKCAHAPQDDLKSLFTTAGKDSADAQENSMSALDELRARMAQRTAAPAAPPPAAVAPPVAPVTFTGQIAGATPAPIAPPSPSVAPVTDAAQAAAAVAQAMGTTPPAAVAPQAPMFVQTAFGALPMPPGQAAPPGMTVVPPPAVVAPGQINPPETSAPVNAEQLHAQEQAAKPAAKRGPGRPRKDATPPPALVAPATSVTVDVAPQIAALAAGAAGRLGTLYVDCLPSGEQPINVAELVGAANMLVCEGWKKAKGETVADWRYIEYGKGGGMLAEAVISFLHAGIDLYLPSETAEGRVLLLPLSAVAAEVIRGVR